jgi:hypothetical protein
MAKLIPTAIDLEPGAQAPEVKILKRYLNRFGYYERVNDTAAAHAVADPEFFDTVTDASLRQYQLFHGLPDSGKLDEGTAAMMRRPRCGLPDLAEFILDGRRWNKSNLTYAVENASVSLSLTQVREVMRQALELWAEVTLLTFTEVTPSQSADLRVRFAVGDHGDFSSFDGVGRVLAHAFFPPPNGGLLAGDAHFDDEERWEVILPSPAGTIDLVTVAAHEFGHALGLAHSQTQDALMFPTYNGPRRFLSPDDIAGIRAIYGVA